MKRITLRQARLDAGLTQDALADKSGIDQTTISNLEVGRATKPTFDTVLALARALGLDPRVLKFEAQERVAS